MNLDRAEWILVTAMLAIVALWIFLTATVLGWFGS